MITEFVFVAQIKTVYRTKEMYRDFFAQRRDPDIHDVILQLGSHQLLPHRDQLGRRIYLLRMSKVYLMLWSYVTAKCCQRISIIRLSTECSLFIYTILLYIYFIIIKLQLRHILHPKKGHFTRFSFSTQIQTCTPQYLSSRNLTFSTDALDISQGTLLVLGVYSVQVHSSWYAWTDKLVPSSRTFMTSNLRSSINLQ